MNPTPDLVALSHLMVERSPLALAVTVGDDHRIHCANSAFCGLTGTVSAALLDRPFAEAVAGAETDGSIALLERVRRTGEGELMVDAKHPLPGGGIAFWSYAVWPMLSGQQRPNALFVEIRDVTERVRAHRAEVETALEMRQAAEQLLIAGVQEQESAEAAVQHSAEIDALLKSMSDGVVVVEAEGRIVLMNAAGREIFRLPSDEEVWVPADRRSARLEQLDGEPITFDQWPIARALRGEQFDQDEAVVVHGDGSRRHVVFSGSALRDEAGHVNLAIVVFRDVTELRRKEAINDQLISLISHDLRSPLGVILGNAEFLQMGLQANGHAKEVRHADAIIHNVKTMDGMIEELLESTRLQSATPQLRKRPCYIRTLISEAVQRLVAPENQERFAIILPEERFVVQCDPERIERVLRNLLGNALKYSPSAAPVTVRLRREGGEALLFVTDRGVGISHEDLPNIFDRFYRAKAGARTDGFGLGLYITRLIIEAHGGRVWADSEPGKGSTFAFALPLE